MKSSKLFCKQNFKNYINQNHQFDHATMLGIFGLVIVIAGVFGFLYEFIFYYFNGGMKEFYWRGGNFLPWINIYATGSIMIYFLTYKKRKNPWKVFLISFFACGILELISGFGMDVIRHGNRCWDYDNEILNFGNIGGYVCFRSAFFFGISSLLLMYGIIPICFFLASTLDKKVFLTISIVLCSIIFIDEFYNLLFARIFLLPRAYDVYKQLGFHFVTFP